MEKYNIIRKAFEKAYQEYKEKLSIYNSEYEKGRHYVEEHKKSYKELTEKATVCCHSRVYANELWSKCTKHSLHPYFKGYVEPEVNKFGIR